MNKYIDDIEKQAAVPLLAAAGKALTGFAGKSLGKRMLIGAMVNAGIKGATWNPNSGQSRGQAMLGGALSGATMGAMVNTKNLNAVKGMFKGSTPNPVKSLPTPKVQQIPAGSNAGARLLPKTPQTPPASNPGATFTSNYTPPTNFVDVDWKVASEVINEIRKNRQGF